MNPANRSATVDPPRAPEGRPPRPIEKVPTWLFVTFIGVVAVAGVAFVFKIVEFARTLEAAPDVSFALMPIVTYLTVAAGFFCLLGWAVLGGHFKDLEGPKHWMLENEHRLDGSARPYDERAHLRPARATGPRPTAETTER